MGFSSYEELRAAVEERRKGILTLEVDLGGEYSPEHEQAKKDLQIAKGMKTVVGGGFLGGDNIEQLEAAVEATRPTTPSIWVQFKKLDLAEWAALIKQQTSMTQIDQYERVLLKTFVGVFGEDPAPEEKPEGWVAPEPLTTDPKSVSTRGGADALLPGGSLHQVVQSFMSWQNSGGEVSIRPTKSGRG